MRPINSHSKSFADLGRFLSLDVEISGNFTGLTTNTEFLEAGDLFIALPGAKIHGASMIDAVVAAGAVGVLTDQDGASLIGEKLPVISHSNPRAIAADIASWFYDRPFAAMASVGITGTNGKTTTASLLFQLWQMQHREVGMIGTIGTTIGADFYPGTFTTPEGTELQAIAAAMRERSLTHVAMEVSSHALAQKRMLGSHFDLVAFTNLTQDHLDFHGTMENYFAAKSLLFTQEYANRGLINIDDAWGKKLYEAAQIPVEKISREDVKADWYYSSIHQVTGGYEVAIRGTGGLLIEGRIPLVGAHNLDNVLMAVALGVASGLDHLAVGRDLERLVGAPGRLEQVSIGQNFLALVDFAHTPDAVTRVLSAVREITPGRVIAVLGCGGDRDSTKRPLMGDALVAGSDVAIFTSDNPRSEDPQAILSAMLNGKEAGDRLAIEADRRGAIAIAVSEADQGDTVIILGKGHELGQEIKGVKHPFEDRIELARAIEQLS
jgi:UDP-N-acetylmuramoyl-L-alanyl-D-glutamate--2,6-diaminopimelate ligase